MVDLVKQSLNHENLNSDSLMLSESILGKIVRQRQQRLLEQTKMQSDIELSRLMPSKISLEKALASSQCGLILECKQSSPSKGLLSKNYQPAIIAKQYQFFCSAISVLTEPDFFAGSLEHLKQVTEVATKPVLCKDFIVEVSQIYSARTAGADVILLMLSVINDEFWHQCSMLADELGLDIITEVNSLSEVERAVALPAKIIGINNRNLHTLKTDISMTEQLVKSIPGDRLIISESGIATHHDLLRLAPLVDGFLIGSSLMQTSSVAAALRKLIFSEVKVCGLTLRSDADHAWKMGASFGGMIFTKKSKRYISKQNAAAICIEQPMPMVGVFMDQDNELICDYVASLSLRAVQLHGDESLEQQSLLRAQLNEQKNSDCEIWKTITCSENDDKYPSLEKAKQIIEDILTSNDSVVDRVLIDIPKQSSALDSDLNFNLLKETIIKHGEQLMLAGGLTIDRVETLSKDVLLEGVAFDICSALELSPGIKNLDRMQQMFNRLTPTTKQR